jgi:integrase
VPGGDLTPTGGDNATKAKSTATAQPRKATKPGKPRADFPLYAHAVGKWAKTIKGKTYYFGSWDDPEGALREYLDQKDDLYAGRIPGVKGGATLREVCNAFMQSKRIDLDAGRLSPRSFVDYDLVCRRLIDQFGPNRSVLDLRPTDFEKLYSHLSRKHSVTALGREVTSTRSVFKYAFESDLIERPVKFGPKFKGPSKNDLRKARAKSEHANGKKLFAAEDIRRMIEAAGPSLKAMTLLGINAGLGNTDVANLPRSALDLKTGWLDYSRRKTGVGRRVPLWSETIEALQNAIANRPNPRDEADADAVFLTVFGQRWVRYEVIEEKHHGRKRVKPKFDDEVSKQFNKILEGLGLKRPRLGFYTLRHTFETIAGGSKDQVAVDAIMGHVDPSMAAEYRHGIEDSRLRAVVDHVRAWLWPAQEPANPASTSG